MQPDRPCARAGCPSLAITGERYCKRHKQADKAIRQEYDKRRGSSCKRGYGRAWQRYRSGYLARHPLCVRCKAQGRIVPATEIDHIINHKGDYDLFWDANNLQGLCKSCHSKKTCKENGGFGNPRKGNM